MAKHPIRNNVIAGLIVLFVVAVLSQVWGTFPAVLDSLSTAATWVGAVLTFQVSLPVWLLIVVGLAILPTLRWLISLLRREPWRKYAQDNFEGMVWRWDYVRGRPRNLVAYCPEDDTAILWTKDAFVQKVSFRCETCDRGFGTIVGGVQYVRDKIERQIERKLRGGEWKSVVATQARNLPAVAKR